MTAPAAGLKILLCLFRNFFYVLKLHGAHLQRQTEQVDEAVGVMVVIEITSGEACKRLTVQRVGRCGSGFCDITLVELEFYFTGHIFLGAFNESLDGFPKWGKPFTFIDYL